jgi:O-antigen/teichoic acid export membrane protein
VRHLLSRNSLKTSSSTFPYGGQASSRQGPQRIGRLFGPVFSFLGRIVGIAVTLVVVQGAGLGPQTTPLFLALALFTLGSSSLTGPLEMQAMAEGPHMAARECDVLRTARIIGAGFAAVAALLLCIGAVFSPTIQLTLLYAGPLLVALPLNAEFAAAQGRSIVHGCWSQSALASFSRAVVVIALTIIFISRLGTAVVTPAFLLGEYIRLRVCSRGLRGKGPRFHSTFARQACMQIPSSVIGSASPTVDRYLVGLLSFGSVALLDLAEKASGLISLAFSQGLLPPLYRTWVRQRNEYARRRTVYLTALVVLLAASLVAVTVSGILTTDVGTAFIMGANSEYPDQFSWTARIFLIGLPAYAASQVLVRLIIIERLTRWFNVVAPIQLILNVVLDLVLGAKWGIAGVAAATSATWWAGFVMAFIVLRTVPKSHGERAAKTR